MDEKEYIFMHDLAACHNSYCTRRFLDINPIENVWNILQKVIGNEMPCMKEDTWKRVCET